MRLHFEIAALHEHQLFLRGASDLDANGARFDLREKRRVARIDAELADDAGQHDELRLAGVDLLFRAHDVDVNGVGHGCSRITVASSLSRTLPRLDRPCRTPARADDRTRPSRSCRSL